MRILKRIFKYFFWLMILAMLIAPLFLIYEISNQEMERYATPEPPQFFQTAFGTVYQAKRMDVAEAVTVAGTFISREFADQELSFRSPNLIRWNVSTGDEITVGQVLGTYKGDPVISEYDGIITEINAYSQENAYLRIRLFQPIEMECYVTNSVLRALQRGAEKLCTEAGEPVKLVFASHVKSSDGLTRVLLSIDSNIYSYGMELKELAIQTGSNYLQALVLSSKCVYQKTEGEDQPWYARRVTADGYFIDEIEVSINYRGKDVVCVSGVTEGEWFDTGYQAIAKEKAG